MKDVTSVVDGWTKRRDVKYDTDESEITDSRNKRTVKINSLQKGKKSWKRVYHRSWLTLLADYEEHLSSNYKITRIEIDKWKKENMYESNKMLNYNYPIIIHYHLCIPP